MIFTICIFILGIAYILRLLNQSTAFDSLHWFDSVREKYIREKSSVERQSAEAGGDQKLQQTLALTLKRLETYQKVVLLWCDHYNANFGETVAKTKIDT